MTPPIPPTPAGDPAQQVQDLLARIFNSSNWRGEVEKTVKKNARLQGLVRDMKLQLDRFAAKFNLETGEPKEGKLLTKDEAAEYDAFAALKMKVADVKKMSEEHVTLKAKQDEVDAAERFGTAAEALGYENVPALTRWLTREKLVLDFKDQRVDEEQEDGSKKKVLRRMPYVRPAAEEKAALEPLEDYIEREVPEFVDIFKTKAESEEGDDEAEAGAGDDETITRVSREAQQRVRGGVRVPATRSARTDTAGSGVNKKLADMEKSARGDKIYSI